jgi:hypothetical protein
MRGLVDLLEAVDGDLGVDGRRRELGVAEHLLHVPDVGSGYLYGNRIVILKEEGVEFPANFRDLGYISFSKDNLDAKAMDVLKELIGFGIVKVST